MLLKNYNPDVLSCLANLSNDEVFTPPQLANQILDLLPQELFENKNTTFLDPCCKSGVFLREIAKRLIKGLEKEIPDLQERLNHIYTKQLYGIAITELTSLLSRSSLYCSRKANGKYSICEDFDNEVGNVFYKKISHTWENGRCKYCGANQSEYDRDDSLETHAYQFIHNPKEILKMKFDVIIGNPPYQLSDGGAQASATPIYNLFVNQAKNLNPRFLTMIIPARWFTGGKWLDDFRDEMLNDNRLRIIHDFENASECFPSVEIKGGVCYFLWDRDNPGFCNIFTHEKGEIISSSTRPLLEKDCDIFIRYNDAITILHKVLSYKEESFANYVSSRKPFGLATNFSEYKKSSFEGAVKLYSNKNVGYIERKQVERNRDWLNKYKIYIPKAIGSGDIKTDKIKPIIGVPNTCCSETYIVVGPFENEITCNNVMSYINTKFFHFLMGLRKITQDATKKVYQFVPMQDFNEVWTDEKLYKKYGLTQEEIEFIESMIRPME